MPVAPPSVLWKALSACGLNKMCVCVLHQVGPENVTRDVLELEALQRMTKQYGSLHAFVRQHK